MCPDQLHEPSVEERMGSRTVQRRKEMYPCNLQRSTDQQAKLAANGSMYTRNLPARTPANVFPVSSTFKFALSAGV